MANTIIHHQQSERKTTTRRAILPPIKIITVFGTRPEAIKLAPIIHGLNSDPERFRCSVVVTAQHRAMLDQMLKVFGIKPDVDLDIMEENQSLSLVTQKTLQRLENVIADYAPDLILVQGDTTSTFVGALAGYYQKVKIAHVEAGLRTYQKYSPFPEEMNRRLTSALADIHFAPTRQAGENLRKEGIAEQRIFITGNTVIDAVNSILSVDYHFEQALLDELLSNGRRTIVITAHRRENWGEAFESVAQAVLQLAADYDDLQFIFPMHLNPNVQRVFGERLGGHAQIHLCEPLDYRTFINLFGRCYFILTDSGGIQEEAPTLRKPALVMREVTERPEGMAHGCLKLVGCRVDRIIAEARRLLDDRDYYDESIQPSNPFGDGRATRRIMQAILYEFGIVPTRPNDFTAET